MSEKIKKGIEAAESDITKEKEQREQEEVRECVTGGGVAHYCRGFSQDV